MSGCVILDSSIAARKNGKRLPCEVLQAENAKLREHIDHMHLMRVIDQNENDALQELVRQMHTCLTRPKAYAGTSQPYLVATECPYFTQGACDYNSCGFEQRMRELGIEVDCA